MEESKVVEYIKCSECQTLIPVYKSSSRRKTCSKECSKKRSTKVNRDKKNSTESVNIPDYVDKRVKVGHSDEVCAYLMLPEDMPEEDKKKYVLYCREHGYSAFTKLRRDVINSPSLACSSVYGVNLHL